MILLQTVKQILVLHNNEEKPVGKTAKILNWGAQVQENVV